MREEFETMEDIQKVGAKCCVMLKRTLEICNFSKQNLQRL